MTNKSWGLRRKWNGKVSCPRCASDVENGEEFCWFCGWDMRKQAEVCDRCGAVVVEGEDCDSCGDA